MKHRLTSGSDAGCQWSGGCLHAVVARVDGVNLCRRHTINMLDGARALRVVVEVQKSSGAGVPPAK